MNTYEGVFILDETLKDEQFEDILSGVRKDIESLGGEVDSVTRLGRRPFARPQQKKKAGAFVVMIFSMEPDKVASLLARMKLKNEIFRVQIVRAPKSGEEPAAASEQDPGTESARDETVSAREKE